MLYELLPEAKNYDLSAYEKTLDEAEAYYLEHATE